MAAQDRFPYFVEDQREFFDSLITEDWETYFSASWDAARRYEIACLFKQVKPATILDIGCGCGFHDSEMASYPFVQAVDAFDYSEKSVERAEQSYCHSKVRRWVGNFAVDKPRRPYELVVSFQVVEHLADPRTYFDFCRAACSADGWVAIFTPNRARLSNRLRARNGLPPELLDPQHFKEYTAEEIIEMGRRAGFQEPRHFGYGMWGQKLIDRIPPEWRLHLGRVFPAVASSVAVLLKAPRK